MAHQADLRLAHGLPVCVPDAKNPRQRSTNENTSGLLRQCFPDGTDLAAHGLGELDAVASALNGKPCKTRGWRTHAEALDVPSAKTQDAGVATTG